MKAVVEVGEKMMKKRIRICALCLAMIFIAGSCGDRELTLEKIAYDKSAKDYTVYLKENGEYVPYLVLSSDYNGNVLLLRKYLLPENMQYKKHSEWWTRDENGSYYEESSVDDFLNTEFYDSLSPCTKDNILECEIEVTSKESYQEDDFTTHYIPRKVFLLSAFELYIGGMEYSTAEEGKRLKYFKKMMAAEKSACLADGKKLPYWTRTPFIYETCTVVVVGTDVIGASTADLSLAVRPAFCMDKETVIKKSGDVITGEQVYVIE